MLQRHIIAIACGVLALTSSAQTTPRPVIGYESVLDTPMLPQSGMIRFTEYDVVFAPEDQLDASVAVTDADNTVIASFPFFPDYKYRAGVFARAQVRGPADVTLTEPGVYNIIFLIAGKPVTRLPVVVERISAGDDPFNPEVSYSFFGLWQSYGYLRTIAYKETTHPSLVFWVGQRDLPEGRGKDKYQASLYRDGELVGYSKKDLGFIADGHYKRATIDIYFPHDDRQSQNAEIVTTDEWTRDGSYTLEIKRQSDDHVIRRFTFTAKDGKIQQLPSTQLGFEPGIDYMTPRVMTRHASTYEFEEAIWIRGE